MVVYTAALLAFAAFGTHHPARFLNGLGIVAVYSLADLLWNRAVSGRWSVPVSSFISGFILAIVALPVPGLAVIVILPLIAATTKHLLHFGRSRHVFNPAASALAVVCLFMPAVSWWGASWGNPAIIVVAAIGAFILWRQQRWHTALAFFAIFLPLSCLAALLGGGLPSSLPGLLQILVFDGVTIFFASVMLIEPVTSYFPTRRQRTVYGALVGLFAAAASFALSRLANTNLDPLLVGLLLGNLTASLLFLPKAEKRAPI